MSGDGQTILEQIYPDPVGAMDASYDGSVVVGGIGKQAFRKVNGQLQFLGMPSSEFNSSIAWAVSADGQIVVGRSVGTDIHAPFRWTSHTGMQELGTLSGATRRSGDALGISSDGSTIVGITASPSSTQESYRQEAYRWTETEGMQPLGILEGGRSSAATAASRDGKLIVGASETHNNRGAAFIWDDENGMRKLSDVLLSDYGVDDLQGYRLNAAQGISSDGNIIVGWAFSDSRGEYVAWRVDLVPEPSTATLVTVLAIFLAPCFFRRRCCLQRPAG
jgi:probable HAF family extracellular repeat protein